MKIKIVTEKEPWEVFLEDNSQGQESSLEDLKKLFAGYHEFLRDFSENEGQCLLCERKFRPRKEETPPPPPAPKDKKGKKVDV